MQYEDKNLQITIKETSTTTSPTHHELSHWHDGIELIWVQEGSLSCQTNDDCFPLSNGDLCFINQGQLHRTLNPSDSARYITLIIGKRIFSSSPEVYEKYIRPLAEDRSLTHTPIRGHGQYEDRIRTAIKLTESYMEEKPEGYELELIALCHQIIRYLHLVLTNLGEREYHVDGNIVLAREMMEYIAQHYGENIQLCDIASAVNISESKCSKVFRQYTGIPPISYLISYRLEKSAELLQSTMMPISQIALECGFSQQSYYTKLFARTYGSTPLGFRKKHTKVTKKALSPP